ncbi:MAG TPA: hypothetical protein VGW78_07105 [Candidatus Babeliales bacterium]|jgi:hypothetical protein|nr:hypothetical protein [Candidatus Babeliales bacterium]
MKCLYYIVLQSVLLLTYINAQGSDAYQKYLHQQYLSRKQDAEQQAILGKFLAGKQRERDVLSGAIAGLGGYGVQKVEGTNKLVVEISNSLKDLKDSLNQSGKNIVSKNYPSLSWNPTRTRFGQAIKWAGLTYMAYQPYAYWRQTQEIEKNFEKKLGEIEETYKQEKVLSKPQEVPTMPQEVPAARPWYKFW